MTGSPRLRAAAFVSAGTMLLGLVFASGSGAQTDGERPGLLAYNLRGDSDAISMMGGQQASQGYPQAVSQTAHVETRVDTGPNTNALASMQWPGQFLGNLGSLIQALGGPPEAGNLNYPVRAEASSSGPARAEDNGAVAVAENAVAQADARIDNYDDGAEVFSFGDARTTSRSALEGALGVTSTSATVTDIVLGGGQITIDSVITKASVSTDGVAGVANGETTVSGLEVAGQPATVDENGVRFAGNDGPSPADAVGQAIIDEALANFSDGFTVDMYVSEPTARDEGGLQEYRSGSLVILMTFGDPKGDGGDGAFIVGGSNAYAQATQGFPPPEFVPPTTAAVVVPPPVADTGSTTGPLTPSTPAPTTASAPAAEEVAAPPAPAIDISSSPIARFSGVPFMMPFLVLLASLFIGRGLHLLHGSVVSAPLASCATGEGGAS